MADRSVTVARLDRPGGNVTGFATNEASLGGKWLELLGEIAPGLKRAAIMFNPDTAAVSTYVPSFEAAARSLKVMPIVAPVRSDAEIEAAIKDLGRKPGGGLFVIPDGFTLAHRAPIISVAARNNVPAVYSQSAGVRDGGLLSYGVDQVSRHADLHPCSRQSSSSADAVPTCRSQSDQQARSIAPAPPQRSCSDR
jgi:putative ABC transport system substrate-binding protein